MKANVRPTRPGMVDEGATGAAGRDGGARGGARDAGRDDGHGVEYPIAGSTALAPAYEVDTGAAVDEMGGTPGRTAREPLRARTAEQRRTADEAAAFRAAAREANASALASRRRLRVAPPLPVNVARAPFVVTLLGIVVLGVAGILVLNTMINANQFHLNNLQAKQAGLDKQEQGLKDKLAHQEAPGSLVAAAKCLGLVPAGTLAYIKMPDGTLVGVPQPATHTTSVTHQSAGDDDPSTAACIDDAMNGD